MDLIKKSIKYILFCFANVYMWWINRGQDKPTRVARLNLDIFGCIVRYITYYPEDFDKLENTIVLYTFPSNTFMLQKWREIKGLRLIGYCDRPLFARVLYTLIEFHSPYVSTLHAAIKAKENNRLRAGGGAVPTAYYPRGKR